MNGFFSGTLIVDEAFMLESSLCTLLSQLSLLGAHMIIAGDQWQLEPIVPSAPILDSDLLYCLAPVYSIKRVQTIGQSIASFWSMLQVRSL